jgi:hypothetical protein
MGRHSVVERGTTGTPPGGPPQPLTSARKHWTTGHKVLAMFLGGSIIAAFVLIMETNAPLHHAHASHGLLGKATGKATQGPDSRLDIINPAVAQVPSSDPPRASSSHHTRKPPVTASPSPQASASSSLAELPINTELTGSEATAWVDACLAALGAPTTTANVKTMRDWFSNEGTPHAVNNPLNLATPYGGSTVTTAAGSPASDHIQAYPAPADFVAAFPIEMNNGSYPEIVAALKAGVGLEGSAATSRIAEELSIYSGGGYDSIPA